MDLWTIGHSNHPWDRFVDLLRDHRIEVVADVRSQPYSSFSDHFSQVPLHRSLVDAGFRYVFLGRQLGGRPPEAELYDNEGRVLYKEVAATDRFAEGVRLLLEDARTFRVALMCSEEDPGECHRNLLIGKALRLGSEPVSLHHIRARPQPEQMTLIELDEVSPWRSARSVSPSTRRQASSVF